MPKPLDEDNTNIMLEFNCMKKEKPQRSAIGQITSATKKTTCHEIFVMNGFYFSFLTHYNQTDLEQLLQK